MSDKGRSLRSRKPTATSVTSNPREDRHPPTPMASAEESDGTISDHDESRRRDPLAMIKDLPENSREPRVNSREPRVNTRDPRVNRSINLDNTLVESNRTVDTVLNNAKKRKIGDRESLRDRENDEQLSKLLAELEVCKAKLELAQKEAETAKCKLEVAQIRARPTSGGAASDVFLDNDRVQSWVEQQSKRNNAVGSVQCPPKNEKSRIRSMPVHALEPPHTYAPLMHRPAPELPHFDGNITEWIAFRAEFEDTAPMFSSVNNVSRIRRALKGEARTAVKSIMYTVQDPYEIMEALERHFGDPEEIVLTEIYNVKRMPRLAEDNSNIVGFASHVANAVATIKALRQDKYLHAPELVNKIIDKLNILVRYEWSKYKQMNADLPDLVAISSFLNDISSAAKRTTRPKPSKSRHGVNTVYCDEAHARQPSRPRPPPYKHEYSSDSESSYDDEPRHRNTRPHTVAQVKSRDFKKKPNNFKPRSSPPPPPSWEPTRVNCAICNSANEHKVSTCPRFLEATIAGRWDMAKTAKICFRCLNANHRRPVKCKYVPCGVNQCEAGHHKLLHGLNTSNSAIVTTATCGNAGSVNHVSRAKTYLKIVPVEVTGPSGTIQTHALLDDGSSMTLIERETADRVAPRRVGEPLAIEGIGGHIVKETESCRLKLNIRGLCGRNMESINAHTVNKLSIAPQEVSRDIVEKCEHLTEIRDELCYDRAKPTILIGQDNWQSLVTSQMLCGERTHPVASLTKLGWALHGQYLNPRPTLALVNHAKPRSAEDETLSLVTKHLDTESPDLEIKPPRNDPDKRALSNAICEKTPGENRYREGLLLRTDHEKLPDNCDSLRFVCRGEDRVPPPQACRKKKLIFGSASSPTTALCVKNKNANHRWFIGPEFKRQNKEYWSKEKCIEPVAPSGEERTKAVCSIQAANDKFDYLPQVDRFSKYERLIRATARVMVAAEVWKAKSLCINHETEMNNKHIKLAGILLIRRSQNESYPEEIKHLEAGRALPKKSPLHKIAVKLAKGGVIVLDARTDRNKESIPVLHAKETFTKLLIHHYHEKFNHGNHATVINELKQRYFIVGLRGSIRYITNKCQWCRTYKGATLKAPVGDLPTERLLANQPPLTATAVDLFGPIKSALKVTLKEKAPHEEVLHTLLLEAEHVVNSRPLTPVNPDLESEALTPNHFLLGRSNAMSPLGSFSDCTLTRNSWKQAQALADQFWTRWLKEYRPNLLPRSSAHATAKKLQKNDVVIIADNTMPRGTWPRGIIAQLYPGPDGHIRVADVRTRARIVRRPASRLILICSTEEDGADARGGECRI